MHRNISPRLKALVLALASLGAAGHAAARDQLDERRGSPVFDTYRNPTRTAVTGQCVHSDFRTPGDATSPCNPAAAAQAAPTQAPVADFVPEPEPKDMVPVPAMTAETAADDRIGEPVWFYDENEGKSAGDGILGTTENPDYAAELAAAEAQMNRVDEPPAPQAAAEPAPPVPVPVPPVTAAPPPPPVERVVLDADALFAFNKSTLSKDGARTLDQVATTLSANNFETVSIIGHTDRLGGNALNAKLSEQRAQTVKRHLVEKGIDPNRIEARGVGSSEPVTGAQCNGIKKRNPLIRCLQPDRRVDITVVALR